MLRIELVRLALVMAAGATAGAMAGNAAAGTSIALAGLLAWHGWQAARLMRAAKAPADGQFSGAAGVWRTLGENLLQAAAHARDTERRFATVTQNFNAIGAAFPEPLVLLDERLAVRWSNAAAENLLGCNAEECAGKLLQDVVRHPVLTEYLASANHEHAVEISAPADNGRLLSVRLFSFGDTGGRLLVARDVTRVYKLDAMRRDFVANVSHELRTPLTVISGYLEPLSETLAHDEEWTSHLAMMSQEAARMEALIRDLTVLSRLEWEDERRLTNNVVSIAPLIDKIVAEAKVLSGDRMHDIQTDIAADAALLGDPLEIRSAISNLVFNAVKHTESRTRIEIIWSRGDTHTRLTVRDAGKGIAARHLPRLTERFYRVDTARSRASGGTGLGLAIVKHILLRHDADLIVDSKVGAGTAFTCLFPNERLPELALSGQSVQPSTH